MRTETIAATLVVALSLSGCGSMDSFKSMRQKGDTIYLKGSRNDIQEAAIEALKKRRLSLSEIREAPNGLEIYAEQATVTGMIFNSWGGYGKVTVAIAPEFGAGVFAVSAITRSKAAHEPVGTQDALKGFNYNNPLIARQILEETKETVNAKNYR